MSDPIRTERRGARLYFLGDTYAAKDRIKSMGGHWDGDCRAWWVGAAKAAEAQALVEQLASAPAAPSGPRPLSDDTRIVARCRYKGRTYYAPFAGQTRSGEWKARLVTLDGSIDFWARLAAPGEACDGSGDVAAVVKEYHPREVRYGYGRYTETRHTTLGSLRAFIERERANRESGGPVCAECGKSGELVEDLEDGLLKHRRCCDIPPG